MAPRAGAVERDIYEPLHIGGIFQIKILKDGYARPPEQANKYAEFKDYVLPATAAPRLILISAKTPLIVSGKQDDGKVRFLRMPFELL